MSLIGTAVKRGAAHVPWVATGAIPIAKLGMGSGGALARRRSKAQGSPAIPLRGVALSATGLGINAESAVVQLFNSSGNPAGYGPADDPSGVFYTDTSLISGDVWFVSTSPAGCTITPLAGGSYTIVVAGGTSTGTKTFEWTLRRGIGGVRSTGLKSFTVT